MLLKDGRGTVEQTRAAMIKMRRDGMSQQQIADATGYSKSRVSQLTNEHTGKGFKRHSCKGCIYTGLRHWQNENKILMWELVEMMGFAYCGRNSSRIRAMVSGRTDMRKSDIDCLIRLSGKSYEELFGEVGCVLYKEARNG